MGRRIKKNAPVGTILINSNTKKKYEIIEPLSDNCILKNLENGKLRKYSFSSIYRFFYVQEEEKKQEEIISKKTNLEFEKEKAIIKARREKLCKAILEFGKNIKSHPTVKYMAFKEDKCFVQIPYSETSLNVYVIAEALTAREQDMCSIVSPRHKWVMDARFKVFDDEDLEIAIEFVRASWMYRITHVNVVQTPKKKKLKKRY